MDQILGFAHDKIKEFSKRYDFTSFPVYTSYVQSLPVLTSTLPKLLRILLLFSLPLSIPINLFSHSLLFPAMSPSSTSSSSLLVVPLHIPSFLVC